MVGSDAAESARLVELQIREAHEVAHIAGNQSEIFRDGRRRNQQIHVGNELTLLAERGAQTRKLFDDGIGHGQDGEVTQERPEPIERGLGIRGPEGAFVDFRNRDDADRQTIITQALEQVLRTGAADGRVDQPIGINQIPHGRVIGRVPSSRPR